MNYDGQRVDQLLRLLQLAHKTITAQQRFIDEVGFESERLHSFLEEADNYRKMYEGGLAILLIWPDKEEE